jgi:probable rRNA maturation factor
MATRNVEAIIGDPRLSLDRESLYRCLDTLLPGLPRFPEGTLNVAFVDENECRRLHQSFYNDPDLTDVMTFPGDAADSHAGDIAICPHAAATSEEARNFAHELTLYLVHGCLHLCGFADTTGEELARMREEEARAMELLEGANRLLVAEWAPMGS